MRDLMVLGLSAFSSTFGLVVVFFVIFPALAQGLIGFALVQTAAEHRDNEALIDGTDVEDDVRV